MARSGASEVLDKPAEVPANITGFSVRLAGVPANNSEESDLIAQLAKITPENPI